MTFGTTPKDNAATPLGSVYVPGTASSDLTALEGMAINTDGNSQKSSAARMGAKAGDIVDLATLLTLAGTSGDANTVASLMGRLTKIRDLLNTTLTVGGTITEANSGSILADLAILAGAVTSSKMATKSASGDFADGAITTLGLEADANTVNTVMGRLTKIRDLLNGTLTVGGTITEANSGSILADLATLAGAVSSSKMATKAASGDFADGAITTLGLEADANTVNTVMGRLTKIRDLLNATLTVSVSNANANGQATSVNSAPVVIASDQSSVQVKRASVAAYTLASVTTSGSTQNSGDITVGPYTEISIDINTTAQAGTSPTIQYFYERKAADGIYYILWQSAVLTAATNTLSTSIGAGMAYNQSLGVTGRLRWVVGGSATPTFTHTANIQGK